MERMLLVPLDGSQLAETAVPVAVALARCLPARLVLLHIHERDAPPQVHGQKHLREPVEARAYLNAVKESLVPPDVKAETRVVVGESRRDVARAMVREAEELRAYIAVMCTHGRGGLRDALFGSIAQQFVAQGNRPVLVVKPRDAALPTFQLRRILVALDGKPSHEAGLRMAEELAQACGSEIVLATVVPTAEGLSGEEALTRMLLPSAVEAMLELAEQGATQYLARLAAGLANRGLKASGKVLRGAPDTALVALAKDVQADVIVLATHRRAGLDAFWSGSMAPRIAAQCDLPLLLVPVTDEQVQQIPAP